MGTTTKQEFEYPDPSDRLTDLPATVQALADRLDLRTVAVIPFNTNTNADGRITLNHGQPYTPRGAQVWPVANAGGPSFLNTVNVESITSTQVVFRAFDQAPAAWASKPVAGVLVVVP